MRRKQTGNEDRDAYREGAAADPEQLVQVPLNDSCATCEVSAEGLWQVSCQICLRLLIWEMNNDPERLVRGQLSGPSDDIFLGFLVEVLLTKWKRVERMEELRDLIDADFDHVVRNFVSLRIYSHQISKDAKSIENDCDINFL
jgi:hypothetical protein